MFDSDTDSNKEIQNSQDAKDLQNDSQAFCTQFAQGKKSNKGDFYTAADVAKIIGVKRQTVEYWRKKNYFVEDLLTHDGIYLYSKERVEQLKSVYRRDWQTAWARPNQNTIQKFKTKKAIPETVISQILAIPPADLVAQGFLKLAKDGKSYVCPFCGNGEGEDGTGITPAFIGGAWIFHCFKCGESFNNFRIFSNEFDLEPHGKDFIKLCKRICTCNGIRYDFDDNNDTDIKKIDLIKADIAAARAGLNDCPTRYFRGLTFETLSHFNCGFLPEWTPVENRIAEKYATPTPRLIIPAGNHYLARLTVQLETYDQKTQKYIKPKQHEGNKYPFNFNSILADEINIIVEGEFDAMSICQATDGTIPVIATSGADVPKNFITIFKKKFATSDQKPKFLILFDSDETGKKLAPKFQSDLVAANFPAVYDFLFEEITKRDFNDILREEGEKALADIIQNLIQKHSEALEKIAGEIKNQPAAADETLPEQEQSKLFDSFTFVNDYMQNSFDAEIEENKKFAERQTGFSNIDEHQIFSAGLYVLGATPACGKTTFAWQLLNQLVERGETCIYCSYEISKLELATKTIAAQLFHRNQFTTITAAEIRRGASNNDLKEISDNLKKSTAKIGVLELTDETIDELLKFLRQFCASADKPPVVCLDYLQIVPSSGDTAKQTIDDTVRKLKVFQRETGTTFIVISSFNRTNYQSVVAFESFKESGNIEYSADVLWALQLYVVNNFKIATDVKTIREKVDAAKKQQPRQIQLKCLKNRSGNNYDCFFNYFSAHDFFEPTTEEDFEEIEGPPEPVNKSNADNKRKD